MALKPEFSIMGGLAVASVVYAVHSNATPTQADIRALPANTADVDKAERAATWLSVGVVAGISLLARDPGIFMIGSAAAIGMAVWTRHSNAIESVGGRYMGDAEAMAAGTQSTGPQVEETEPYAMFAGSVDEFAR
jgi:hypothetical protein